MDDRSAPVAGGHPGESRLAEFCRDARTLLHRPDGPDLPALRTRFEVLLRDPDFVDRYCGPAVPPGLYRLFRDPELGFEVLAHLNRDARVSPPHDHGASWAIYGQVVSHTDMSEWKRIDDGRDPDAARLEIVRRYRLHPGEAGVYASGAIHSIDFPAGSRFVRVTGTDLDAIPRSSYDPASGAVKRMSPRPPES